MRVMRTAQRIGSAFHGIFAVVLALVLSLQVGSAYLPAGVAPDLAANEVMLELCDGTGLSRIVIDLATGKTRDAATGGEQSGPKCPFCVLGLAAPQSFAPELAFHARAYRAALPLPALRLPASAPRDHSRAIRAPPVLT